MKASCVTVNACDELILAAKTEGSNKLLNRLFPGYQISDSFPSVFYIIHVSFKEFIIMIFLLFLITAESKFL